MAAQYGDTRRASMTGSRGDRGKCTIEVEVDGVAEVEVRGDTGYLRTLTGQPATWRRMECSDALPRNPTDFRFKGIDGRGNVNLVRDPRSNRGTAVVRIEDRKGGREGYTFDLEWTGASGGFGGGGQYPDRGNNRYDRGRDNDYRDDNSYIVICGSNSNRRKYCMADTRSGARLLRQSGGTECREGYSWGYDNRGVWVDRGCRGEFEVGR
jgi:hypothetical protein